MFKQNTRTTHSVAQALHNFPCKLSSLLSIPCNYTRKENRRHYSLRVQHEPDCLCQLPYGSGHYLIRYYTGLFEMIVGVLTTCHTQYTSDSSICVFLFNRTTLQVFVTYRTGALYVHPLWFYKHQHDKPVRSKLSVACQRWWFVWRFWFVPSVPRYLWEEEEHKPDPLRNPIEWNHMGLHLENEIYCVWQVVNTPTIILNKPVFCEILNVMFINISVVNVVTS